jgi:hypothetical protein
VRDIFFGGEGGENMILVVGSQAPPAPRSGSLSLGLMLRSTVSRPVCLGIKHPSGAYDQIFITVRRLRVC